MAAPPGGDTRTLLAPAPAPASRGEALAERILAATLRCMARWGMAKTTLDDIAREAGCSRATVYRIFPGGKDVVFLSLAAHEIDAFFTNLAARVDVARTLEDVLVVAVVEASRTIAGHEAVQYLLEHEPEVILPHVAFDGLDPLLDWAADFGAAHLDRFLPDREARELAEWVARVVVSYGLEPDERLDLTDTAVARRFVRDTFLPALGGAPEPSASSPSTSAFDPRPPATPREQE